MYQGQKNEGLKNHKSTWAVFQTSIFMNGESPVAACVAVLYANSTNGRYLSLHMFTASERGND